MLDYRDQLNASALVEPIALLALCAERLVHGPELPADLRSWLSTVTGVSSALLTTQGFPAHRRVVVLRACQQLLDQVTYREDRRSAERLPNELESRPVAMVEMATAIEPDASLVKPDYFELATRLSRQSQQAAAWAADTKVKP